MSRNPSPRLQGPSRDEFALAIGRFILEFCECEFWTHLLIRAAGSEADVEAARNMPLGGRKALLGQLLGAAPFNDTDRDRWTQLLATMNRLEKHRDIVAHNPPLHGIYVDDIGQPKRHEVRFELRSMRRPDIDVSIPDLSRFADQAKELQLSLGCFFVLLGSRREQASNPDREATGE